MFPYNHRVLAPLLRELDQWRTLLDQRGVLPRTWAGRLRRDLEVEAVAASTSMEGIPVTVDEVRRILVGERPIQVSEINVELVRGYRDAMGLALRRADDPDFRWVPEVLLAIHDRVLSGRFDLGAGRYRTGPALLTDRLTGARVFEPPLAARVPTLIDRVCRDAEGGSRHPAELAAWIHVAIAAIHPFRDGNGRTARVAASLAMLRGGSKMAEFTSLEEWWGRHLADYYRGFRCLGAKFNADADVTDFVALHVQTQVSQVRALDLRQRVQREIWAAIEETLVRLSLPERLANAVWDAFFGREVTSRYYRSLTDVSQGTAASDLMGAVAGGLLEARGAGRSRAYGAGSRLMPEVGRHLNIEVTQSDDGARALLTGVLADRVSASGLGAKLRARRPKR